jgi:hypothetical protein
LKAWCQGKVDEIKALNETITKNKISTQLYTQLMGNCDEVCSTLDLLEGDGITEENRYKVKVPRQSDNFEGVKIRKVTFTNCIPDPVLLILKGVANWMKRMETPLIMGCPPFDEEESDDSFIYDGLNLYVKDFEPTKVDTVIEIHQAMSNEDPVSDYEQDDSDVSSIGPDSISNIDSIK